MQHGTTSVIWEPETPSDRSCYVYFRLERSCAAVTWHRPSWRRLKTQQEYNLSINPEELVSPRMTYRPTPNTIEFEAQNVTLDEGFLDLTTVKEITMGSRNHEYDSELLAAGKRFGLTHVECCVSILYGNTISENRVICILCPPMLCRLWYVGLNWIIRGIKRQQRLADRSMLWLKEQYIQLYYDDTLCSEPLANDALRLFGGRDWTSMHAGNIAPDTNQAVPTVEPMKREASIKFKKKRSVVNLLSQATSGGSSGSSSSVPELESIREKETSRGGSRSVSERKRVESSDQLWQKLKGFRYGTITHETQLDFLDFITLFKSFR